MKLLFTTLLALASLGVQAQASKPAAKASAPAHPQTPGLAGLGEFKINVTTPAIIDQLCKELGTQLRFANAQAQLEGAADGVEIIQLNYTPITEGGPYDAEACPQSKVFLLPRYEVAGIKLTNLRLKFYNNLLVEIEVDDADELAQGFITKYGKPVSKLISKPVPCLFTHTGNKVTYYNETATQDWYNGDIKAEYMILKSYNDNCEASISAHFLMSAQKQSDLQHKCSLVVYKAAESKELQDKKKKLSDL